MQVNAINSISSNNNTVNEPELVSLNQRMAATQQVNAVSDPNNGDTTTFDSIMEWITASIDQFKDEKNYEFLSEQLNAMIKKMVDDKGNKVVNGFADIMTQMSALKDAVDEAGYKEPEEFFEIEMTKLMGINFFMQDFLNQAMYPSVQNGGKIEAYEY